MNILNEGLSPWEMKAVKCVLSAYSVSCQHLLSAHLLNYQGLAHWVSFPSWWKSCEAGWAQAGVLDLPGRQLLSSPGMSLRL